MQLCTSRPATHLPVGEEDDALDGEELQHRVVRSEKVLRGKVEEEQGVEGHRNAGEGGLFNSVGSYYHIGHETLGCG